MKAHFWLSVLAAAAGPAVAAGPVCIGEIHLAKSAGPVIRRYARVAVREVVRRWGATPTVIEGGSPRQGLYFGVDPRVEGSRVEIEDGVVRATGKTDLLAVEALGRVLRGLALENGGLVYRGSTGTELPAVEMRGIYAPAHFANPYERLTTAELGALFEEWALWGATATWNWCDPEARVDPFSRRAGAVESRRYWQKTLDSLLAAQKAGLEVGLSLGTNVVWQDQFEEHPGWRAEMGPSLMHGQLLCPSVPEARKIILDNDRNLFRSAREAGVPIRSLEFYNRDPSGCTDERCRPWYRTSLALMRDVTAAARQFFPGVWADVVTWYWPAEEEQIAVAWLPESNPSGWLRYWFHHFPTWQRDIRFPSLGLPTGVKPGAMINLSAAEDDVYGAKGAITRFVFLEHAVAPLSDRGFRGLHGYTEGNYDDLNKVLALTKLRDPKRPVGDIVEEYSRWYFGAKPGPDAAELATLILLLDDLKANGKRLPEIVARMREAEGKLPPWGRGWRFEQFLIKAQINEIDLRLVGFDYAFGEKASQTRPPAFKSVIGGTFRDRMRRGLELASVREIQRAAWDAYRYLEEKNALARQRAVLAHRLMDRVYRVDADQAVGLTNIYLGDWPVWWEDQRQKFHRVLDAATVADEKRLIGEFWP